MDLISAFKSELFRPLVTLVVPGAFAAGPYIIVTGYYIPQVRSFQNDHPSAFVVITVIFILASGLILENLGTFIEQQWDRLITHTDTDHLERWDAYLRLELKDEIIGQRFLSTIVTRMKFELSMAPALLSFWGGLLWIDCLYAVWSLCAFIGLSVFISILVVYLILESYKSAKTLTRIRRNIIVAVQNSPLKRARSKN